MRFIVGVMGPAKAKKKDLDNARVLGEFIARRGWVVLTGGRDLGVMDAGKPVILVDASPADVAFFRKLGKRLVSAASSPEEAIELIMKQMGSGKRRSHQEEPTEYGDLAL